MSIDARSKALLEMLGRRGAWQKLMTQRSSPKHRAETLESRPSAFRTLRYALARQAQTIVKYVNLAQTSTKQVIKNTQKSAKQARQARV